MDAFVEVLHENLRSLDPAYLEALPNSAKLSSILKSLEQTISKILPALPVAMRQTETDTEAEKLMQEVPKLAYKLETSLNELQSEAQLARDRPRIRSFSGKLIRCFDPSYFTCVRLQKRLANLKVEFCRIELIALPFSASAEQPDYDPAAIYGREKDLLNLGERLLSDEQHIAVLRIVGSPGIGKTALARLACRNDKLSSLFDVSVWLQVSENFDVRRASQDLLNALRHEKPYDIRDLPSLQQQLRKHLSAKRVLLVLDDVREIYPEAWETFIDPLLHSAAQGSRVLMTMTTHPNTAPSEVTSLPYEGERYELKPLTDEDCWSLLASVAFPNREPHEYSHLESVGKKMAEKCEGHPLTAKVLGSILRGKMNESEWETVLKYGPWESGDIWSRREPLFMSYDGLTARLKLCFAYCSIFPKDYKLIKEMLLQFWMAEDFVQVPQEHRGTTTLETIAERYFDALKTNNLCDYNEDEGISMHGSVSALAHLVSGKACYHLKNDNQENSSPHDGENRHSSTAPDSPETIRYMSCIYDVSLKFERLSRYTNLRTLLIICNCGVYSNQVLPNDLFNNFPELRVLSLSGFPLENLPDSIDHLIQLRFLDLSHTPIEKLPQAFTTLSNLLTLKLNNCIYLAELPSMKSLTKLRHLDISGSKNIKVMPPGIGGLTDLRMLSNFIIGGVNGSPIQELKDLVHLSGKLSISGLQNVVDPDDAKEANLSNKTSLRELILEWNTKFTELRDKDVETEVLNYLKGCSNLEILRIIGFGGTGLPEWISLCDKLVHVTLSNCRNSKNLPLLGQLAKLKELNIEGMEEVIGIGTEFCGDVSLGVPFPSLETLEFKDMPKWEVWSFGQVKFHRLPCLQLLKIERCPKLKEFKVLMKVLKILTINDCQELTAFSIENFPSLCELDIQHCSNLKEMPQSFPSLTKLRIWGCQELTSLSKVQPNGDKCEEFPRLLTLDIQNCRSLKELPSKFPLLEKLRIRNCKELFKLSVFPHLHDLILEECDELMLENEVEVSSLVSMAVSQLPKLVQPPAQLLQCLSRLRNLEISKCMNLVALTENGSQAVSSLERLLVDGCPKLKQLPDLFSCFSSLKELIIVGYETPEFFPEMTLPAAFKRLVIQRCKLLKSLPPKLFDSQDIGLEFLEVYGCPSLESISQGKLPQTLRLLSIWDCRNLKSLPRGLNQENTSLTSLRIWDCQSLQDFPHEGLPRNIRSLSVMNCSNLRPLSEWGLEELECLRNFSFGGCPEMDHFGHVTFPDSVSFVLLKGLPRIVSLAGLFENLNSLDILTIRDCVRLEILAEMELPDSVSCLYISNCPGLRDRCRREEGQEWPKIAHIPLVEFDFQSMP
ncbi:Apoptotic ATPase [Handroanthus impetiginosus]|uniref:Apoptotic ATPase n=1 Tax=Handroanthus impetiginosus TaxID=429701 RepID=A0A2G9GR51_9LAMI|nr:Apoptotic ATPase [Handroanthus impetiginosus]